MDLLILKNLLEKREYTNKVIYHLKPSYFEEFSDRIIFKIIRKYVDKYSTKKLPTATVLKLIVSKSNKLTEDQFEKTINRINEIESEKTEDYEIQWLIDETEDFCKSKAMENAIIKSVDMLQEGNKQLGKIQELVRDALKVSFENDLGINFFDEDDIDERIEYYNRDVFKLPCNITELNNCFNGGFEEKSITFFMGGQHSGKTQTMRSICKDQVEKGIDCAYITLEMSQEKISTGFEANILDVPINDVPDMNMETLKEKIISHGKKGCGILRVKEWATRGASPNSIRNYLDDLWIKTGFKPKVLFVDYINLLNSDLYTGNQEHLRIKSIAEELRGVAVDYNLCIITGTQTNRAGDNASDLSLREIADSYGLSGPADAIVAIISTPDMREQGILIYKIIKNRFGGVIDYKFPVKAETEYSRISNVKKDEIPNLLNTEESKAKMQNLQNKFKHKKETQEKRKINLTVNKKKYINEITELMK